MSLPGSPGVGGRWNRVRRRILCALWVLGLMASGTGFAQVGLYKDSAGTNQHAQGVTQIALPQSNLVTLTAAATSGNSVDQVNGAFLTGVMVGINCTAVSGTSPTLVVAIQGKDPSGSYFTILQSSSITGAGFTPLTIYPGIAAVANASISDFVPQIWRVSYTIGGTSPSYTCTISSMPK